MASTLEGTVATCHRSIERYRRGNCPAALSRWSSGNSRSPAEGQARVARQRGRRCRWDSPGHRVRRHQAGRGDRGCRAHGLRARPSRHTRQQCRRDAPRSSGGRSVVRVGSVWSSSTSLPFSMARTRQYPTCSAPPPTDLATSQTWSTSASCRPRRPQRQRRLQPD